MTSTLYVILSPRPYDLSARDCRVDESLFSLLLCLALVMYMLTFKHPMGSPRARPLRDLATAPPAAASPLADALAASPATASPPADSPADSPAAAAYLAAASPATESFAPTTASATEPLAASHGTRQGGQKAKTHYVHQNKRKRDQKQLALRVRMEAAINAPALETYKFKKVNGDTKFFKRITDLEQDGGINGEVKARSISREELDGLGVEFFESGTHVLWHVDYPQIVAVVNFR